MAHSAGPPSTTDKESADAFEDPPTIARRSRAAARRRRRGRLPGLRAGRAAGPAGPAASGSCSTAQESSPRTMNGFLTAVTRDVDALLDAGSSRRPGCRSRGSPTQWIPGGRTAASACGDATARSGTTPPPTARATTRSTSPRGSRPASATGRSTAPCPGSSQGYGAHARRLRGRLHRRPRVRPPDPGRARPVPVATAGRCRRWPSSCRPTATPARGRRASADETGSRTETSRRRSNAALAVGDFDAAQPEPPRHARAARAGLERGLRDRRPVRLQRLPGRLGRPHDLSGPPMLSAVRRPRSIRARQPPVARGRQAGHELQHRDGEQEGQRGASSRRWRRGARPRARGRARRRGSRCSASSP